jgi:hypothetical protein
VSPVDHLEAALERVSKADIAALPPARRERLRVQFDALVRSTVRPGSAAAEGICPSCGEATVPEHPTCGDAACRAQEPPIIRPGGVLALLARGDRSL